MLNTSQLRSEWAAYRCNTSRMVRVAFPGPGRMWNLLVAREAKTAFGVLAMVMTKHGYLFRESAGGTYNCRKIAGSNNWSLHSYGIAIDLNPSKNPYNSTKTDMPEAFRKDVKSIKTNNGKQVFGWGGDWSGTKDTMHWQIVCRPEDLATGIRGWDSNQPPADQGGTYTVNVTRANIKKGDKGQIVKIAQGLLAAHGQPPANTFNGHHVPDGVAGDGFDKSVRAFQKAHSLSEDGVVGPKTWAALESA